MSPCKAPNADGFQPIFFQKCWHIVGTNVLKVALNYLNEEILPKELNETLIVFILKMPAPEHLKKFCPILPCNVVYKAITKALVNKLKPFLPKVVIPTQFSFILGRNISENMIVYQEVLHSFQTRKGSKDDMLTKLDLAKAYDN